MPRHKWRAELISKIVRRGHNDRPHGAISDPDKSAFISRDVDQPAFQWHEKRVLNARPELVAFVEQEHRRRSLRFSRLVREIICKSNLAENKKLSLPFLF